MARRSRKSVYLQVYGKSFELFKAVVDAVLAEGGSDDDLERLLTDESMRRDVARRIVRDRAETLTAAVNYDRSVADGVAAGKYDWESSDITEKHYPRSGVGTQDVTFSLIHFGKKMSTEDALGELDRRGFRPATLQELLAIGEQHPEKQQAFPIIALGSVWQDLFGRRFVPFLVCDGSERRLDLLWVDAGWFGFCRFLAVRK